MELRHLQALVAVAEHGSFSSAADHLGTVQSNISAHVARLERELGTTLVDRSAGRLTADGEVVVARAYRVMGELDALVADVGALREAVAGNVRVGILGTTARWLVPMLLAELSASHPRLHLVVADGTTLGLEPQLAAGRLDLAVLTVPGSRSRPCLRNRCSRRTSCSWSPSTTTRCPAPSGSRSPIWSASSCCSRLRAHHFAVRSTPR